MYVGIVIGLVFAVLCAALGAILIFRGKNEKQSDEELVSEKCTYFSYKNHTLPAISLRVFENTIVFIILTLIFR